jgi:hypothetical protein
MERRAKVTATQKGRKAGPGLLIRPIGTEKDSQMIIPAKTKQMTLQIRS